MHQLLYRSCARDNLESGEVFRIIQTASRKNPDRDITGFLVFMDDVFLQLVEGPEAALDALLDDLAEDPRHHSIEVLAREPIDQRSFPAWRMERVTPTEAGSEAFMAKLADARVAAAARQALGAIFDGRRAA